MPDQDDAYPIPIDPDIDLHVPEQRQELARTHGAVLVVISAGGALGHWPGTG